MRTDRKGSCQSQRLYTIFLIEYLVHKLLRITNIFFISFVKVPALLKTSVKKKLHFAANITNYTTNSILNTAAILNTPQVKIFIYTFIKFFKKEILRIDRSSHWK